MILMYHKIYLDSPTMWWVTVNDFYRQMAELSSKEVVFLEDYDVNNPNQVVITFDGVYKNVLQYAMPIMKHFGYPFELFITSDYLDKDNEFDSVEPNAPFTSKEELQELVANGGRLQWHTKSHPNLKEVTDRERIIDELSIPEDIKSLDPAGFNWFAYPHGEFNDVVVEETAKRFKGAVSCNQGNDSDIFKLNRLTVVNETSLRKENIACIIASYNYGDFLIEAIESVLKQTIVPDEILITDDHSDDDTQLIAEGYVKKYPNLIKYNRNETNLGIVAHFNKAIKLTTAEYVFFLGADNRLVSNYVEDCSNVLDHNKDAAIAYTDYAFFGSRAKLTHQNFTNEWKGAVILDTFYQINFPEFDTKEALVAQIEKRNCIHGSSMYRRSVFDEVGGYITSKKAEDYNLFKRIIAKGWTAKKARNTNLEYRQHNIYQANNIVGMQLKMMHYKKMYEETNKYNNSTYFKISYKIYKGLRFIKYNYKSPLRVLKAIKGKLFK